MITIVLSLDWSPDQERRLTCFTVPSRHSQCPTPLRAYRGPNLKFEDLRRGSENLNETQRLTTKQEFTTHLHGYASSSAYVFNVEFSAGGRGDEVVGRRYEVRKAVLLAVTHHRMEEAERPQ